MSQPPTPGGQTLRSGRNLPLPPRQNMSGPGSGSGTGNAGNADGAAGFTAATFAAALRQLVPAQTEAEKQLKEVKDIKIWAKFFALGDKTIFSDWYANLQAILDLADCGELLQPDQNGVGRLSPELQRAAKQRVSTFCRGNDIYRMQDPNISLYTSLQQLRETKLGAADSTYQKYSDMLMSLTRLPNEGVVQLCDRASEYYRMVRDH